MSSPESPTPSPCEDIVPASLGQLAQSLPTFLGFAVPVAELHSIPLPAEFGELVRSARGENHVDVPLPKFFNPLFRRQGVVNKHTINALESVGDSLNQLAREIEARDRIIEQLTSHFNSYTDFAHRGQVTVVHFVEQLAKVSTNLQKRIDQETERSQIRLSSLVASVRASERRTTDLDNEHSELNRQLGMLRSSLDQINSVLTCASLETADQKQTAKTFTEDTKNHLTTLQDVLRDTQAASAKFAQDTEVRIKQLVEVVNANGLAVARRADEYESRLTAHIAECQEHAALQSSRHADIARKTSVLETRVDDGMRLILERLAQIEAQAATQRAATPDADTAFLARIKEHEALVASNHAASTDAHAALQERIEAHEGHSRVAATSFVARLASVESRTEAQQTEISKSHAAVGEQMTMLNARVRDLASDVATSLKAVESYASAQQTAAANAEAALQERITAQEALAAARQIASIDSIKPAIEKIAALETILHIASTDTKSQLAIIAEKEDLIASTARVLQREQLSLASELERLRIDLGDLASVNAAMVKNCEGTDIMLNGVKAALDTLLKPDQAHPRDSAEPADSPISNIVPSATRLAQTALSDAFYVAFEARFRGPRKLIRERQSIYLPMIAEARERVGLFPPARPNSTSDRATPPADGVIDLGCGRGEWIELLGENGIPALGVERNQFFLDMCRQKNCRVVAEDLMEFLRSAPSESVSAVTSFHVIEHLPIPVFEEMTKEIFRILRRGGLIILETPNPANVITSSLSFWSDPTHLRPVHPDFGKLLVEIAGFTHVNLKFLSPVDPSFHVGSPSDPLAQRFNELCYGPQDFSILGIKP